MLGCNVHQPGDRMLAKIYKNSQKTIKSGRFGGYAKSVKKAYQETSRVDSKNPEQAISTEDTPANAEIA